MQLYHHLQSTIDSVKYTAKLNMDKFLECEDYDGLTRKLDDGAWREANQKEAHAWVWFSIFRVEHLEELNYFHKSLIASLLKIHQDDPFVSQMPQDMKEKFELFVENRQFWKKLEEKSQAGSVKNSASQA